MIRNLLAALFSLVPLFGPLGSKAATIDTYGSRGSWEAASGVFVVETFETASPVTASTAGDTLHLGDFDIEVDSNHGGIQIGSGCGIGSAAGFCTDLHTTNFGGPPLFFVFEFLRPVSAFAVDLAGLGNDGLGGGAIVASFGGPSLAFDLDVVAGTSFFGIVSTDAYFTSVMFTKKITRLGDERDFFGIDNVSYRTAPEPSALGLLAASICCLLATRRGRKRTYLLREQDMGERKC